MKFELSTVTTGNIFLKNDHFVTKTITIVFGSGVTEIKSGTVIDEDGNVMASGNEAKACGLLFNDMTPDNPNGAVVIHGFIDETKLPAAVADGAKEVMGGLTFFDANGKISSAATVLAGKVAAGGTP